MSCNSHFRSTAAALLIAGLFTAPAMAKDWQQAKHPHLIKTAEPAVAVPADGAPSPATGSLEAWQRAKTPALYPTTGRAAEASADAPKAGSIEAWKQAKFPHLQKTTRN